MPRTMSEKHEASLRDFCGIGGTLTVADQLLEELDAERAAHQQTVQAAEKLAEALEREAIRYCQLCSRHTGPGAYQNIYERVPKPRSDGRFFHERHDGVSDGAWLCESQNAVAALAQWEAVRRGK